MLKKIRKILILSLMATMLIHAEGENSSSSNNTEIDEIIRKSESERKKEQREAEREERRRAREEEKARKKAEREAEKAAREAEKRSAEEIGEITDIPIKNQGEKQINSNGNTGNSKNNINNNIINELSSYGVSVSSESIDRVKLNVKKNNNPLELKN